MSPARPIRIVGGGLAGLTLGIALRRRDVPVTVHEAGSYPRHRVCGEFLSGRGREVLRRLGLEQALRAAGAVEARTSSFHSRRDSAPSRPLPEPALCLSRFHFDRVLAGIFTDLGGELRTGERWSGDGAAPGVVLANGRRPRPTAEGWRWFGLKAHARGADLDADLEMHLTRDGYVGLCRLGDGVVNACGLFRARTGGAPSSDWRERLRGGPGTPLRRRMERAVFVEESFRAVAGLDLAPRVAGPEDGCRVGDALTLIPPVTGNGMSMALESAGLAAEPLSRWSRGEVDWPAACRTLAGDMNTAFARRLRVARWLQPALFLPPLHRPLILALRHWEGAWRGLFAATR